MPLLSLHPWIPRREFLRASGLGAASLALPGLPSGGAATSRPDSIAKGSFGRAKSCIILFMFGGPSQIETFDPKPIAPEGIRGEFKPIATSVPGVTIGEHFPRLAQRAHRYAIVRSVTHTDNFHGSSCHYVLTGTPYPRRGANLLAGRPDDYPNVGSAVARLRNGDALIPPFVWLLSPFHSVVFPVPGQGPGFLGSRHAPFVVAQDPNAADFRVPALSIPADVPLERLAQRQGLLDAFNRQTDRLLRGPAATARDSSVEKALQLVRSPRASRAFDLTAEPAALRDRYGRTTFGEGVMLARRLVEHGVRVATVRWYLDETDIQVDEPAWDTHIDNFKRLKTRLMPPLDQTFSALLDDLADRGMLDETLVVLLGEFGRTPKINRLAGREHWAHASSIVMAGGGIVGGRVHGTTDRHGAYPIEKPVTPGDIIATVYHCLGIAPHTELLDHSGRPVPLCSGEPIPGLLA
jgi:hypothetical protein